uniref:Uncharacterized protein n=1 Tax=Opuntia streptacantha TaxID=393608 RepID=A0A7C9DMG8_OPUST
MLHSIFLILRRHPGIRPMRVLPARICYVFQSMTYSFSMFSITMMLIEAPTYRRRRAILIHHWMIWCLWLSDLLPHRFVSFNFPQVHLIPAHTSFLLLVYMRLIS